MKLAAAHLRLAGVLGRRCGSEWYPWDRNDIAVPFWASVGTGEGRVAGGERENAAVVLSDDNKASSARVRSRPLISKPTADVSGARAGLRCALRAWSVGSRIDGPR